MGLTFSNTAIRPLTEDELKIAKDVLVARAASAGRVSPDKISSQLLVALGEWVPAFHLGVQTNIEVRAAKLEAVTRPFKDGMMVPPAPTPVVEPFDVWSVPTPPRTGTAAKDFILIPATLEKKDCQACLGKASVPCKACFSKGAINCDGCMGAGSTACSICKGLSKISCPDCEGTGRIKAGGMTNRVLGPCGSCNGMGKFNCTHCAGGKVDCGTCGNTGKKPCPQCEGQGKQNCTACAGSAKVVIGKGFQVEFRPQQAQASAMGAPAPQGVEGMALTQKSAPAAFEFPSEDAFRRDVAAADIPEGLRGQLEQLMTRVKPPNASARLGALKLSVAQGAAWRLAGSFAGHEFVYWIHPATHTVVAEKDPVGEVNQKSVATAQEALRRGDWEVAMDAARETLAMDPNHAEAKTIAAQWRNKLMREVLLVGVGGGALAALLAAAGVFTADKGLYRFGPAVVCAVAAFVVVLGAVMASLPVLKHLFPAKKRLMVGGGVAFGALIFFFTAKGMAGWNPVRSADQKALAGEMKKNFELGANTVYHEADLAALQGLYEKYKDSQADLSELNNQLQAQIVLKTQHDALVREFNDKLEEAVNSNMFGAAKRERILELKEHYALRQVDVSPADEALATLDDRAKKAAAAPAPVRSTRGKISITPFRAAPSSARKTSPSSSAKKAAVKAPAKKAVAPAKSKAKPAAKKKKITPNKEIDPKAAAKKKKGGLFGGGRTVD